MRNSSPTCDLENTMSPKELSAKEQNELARFRGGVWTCKIKTQAYLDKLYALYGADGLKKYGE